MKCLNIKNKEVKAALDEVTAALGSEDAAYYVISENEGYAIDLAPNGEPSKLFSDLLSHFNGDRVAAIKAKVKTFTPAFKAWFGESKVVDLNGEPMIVYHGTKTSASIKSDGFSPAFTGLGNKGAALGYFYFTNSYDNARYTGLTERLLEPLIDIVLSVYDLFDSTTVPSTKELYSLVDKNQSDIQSITDLIYNLPLDSFIRNFIDSILKFFNAKYRTAKLLKALYNNTIDILLELINDLQLKILVSYNYSLGMLFLSGNHKNASVNPLHFIKEVLNPNSNFRQSAGDVVLNTLYGTEDLTYSPEVLPVFLNIKNPLESDFNMKATDENPLSAKMKFSDELIQYSKKEENLLLQLEDDKYDGAISKNKFDILFSDVYITKNPNLIKSIDNAGAFSTADNRIMYTIEEESSATSNFDEIFSNLMLVETGVYDSRDLVEYIKLNIKVKNGLRRILNLVGNMPVKIKILTESNEYMYYNPMDDSIYINPLAFNDLSIQYNAQSIAHELVHWYVINAHRSPSNAKQEHLSNSIKDTYAFYKLVLKNVESEGTFYGLKDEDEFIAELLTNSDFVNELFDIAMAYDNKGTLLGKLKRLLNMISLLIVDTFGVDLGTISSSKIKELLELQLETLDFIATYNTEEINNVADFKLSKSLLVEFFQRSLNNDNRRIQNKLRAFNAYNFDTKEELDKRLDNIRATLTEKLESRHSAVDIEDKVELTKTKLAIKYQLTNLRDNAISTIDNVKSILLDLKVDLQPVAHKVINAYNDKIKPLSNEELISLDRNFFGFYCPVLADVLNSLSGINIYREYIGYENYDKIMSDIKMCRILLDECASYVKKLQVKNATLLMLKVGIQANSPTIYNYIALNTYETGFEISTLTRLLGAGDKINDEALKSLYKIILDSEDRVNDKTFSAAVKLRKLLKKAKNKQSRLFEVDDNGQPTGYIIREKNYGKFHNNYKLELERIKKQLGLNPGELGLPENKDLRKEYNKLRNKWLSENCERKYTDTYYKMFEDLSQEATDARELILSRIKNLTDKVKNNKGIPEFERLSLEEWEQLNALYIEKKQLSSMYDVYGQPKLGIDKDIAIELSELNEKLAEGMKMRTNKEAFEKVRAEKEANLSAKDYLNWLDRNTRVQYKEEFYELLKKVERSVYGDEYVEKNDEKRAILNMFRNDKTGEIQRKLMPNITINRINELDRELRILRKRNKKAPKEGSILFEDIAKIVPTKEFNDQYRQAVLDSQEDPMALEVFLMQHTYQDKTGKHHPKSYYSKIVPKDESLIERVPSSGFSELSPLSAFYNDQYDHTNTEEYYQPKDSAGYKNKKAFDKLTPELLELRKAILDIMQESNSKLTNLTRTDAYRMPLISGSMLRFMKSNMGYIKGFTEYIKDGVSTKGDDEGIHEAPKYAPDGTSLNFVPQYFVKELDDVSTITADLVGSVLRYYKMADNFKEKNAIRGDVEIIKKFLAQRKYTGSTKSKFGKTMDAFSLRKSAKEGKDTNIYKFAEQFIAMNLYNVQSNSITIGIGEHNFNLFGKEIHTKARDVNVTKMLTFIKGLGTLRNLGLSMWVAGTGFFTASHNHIVLTLVGRYYDWHDALNATKAMVYDTFKYGWRTVGNQNYKSKQMALMDYFLTGGTIESIYENSNELAPLRFIAKHWAFGMYSLSDYLIKGTILNSVMYNYKNVNGEFICKEDYLNKYGNTETTKSAWKKYKSAYDSVDYVNGQIQVKDEKDSKAWEKSKFVIGRTALNLGASADGTLTALQKALFSSNVFGAMAMMHRQYLPLAILEKWNMDMQWDYTAQRYREAVLKTPLRVFKLAKKDERNISFIKKFILYSNADTTTRANMKQLGIEAVLVLGLYPLLRTMVNDAADDDKNGFWINLLAYIMMRTSFEVGAPYNFIDIARTVKNPTPLFSMLDNWGSIISYPLELAYNVIMDKKGSNKKITRGAYKDMTPILKAIIQATPAKNLIEIQDLPSKRNYYEKQILGN